MALAPRVRLAPSPTGLFHVGTARTALFNWLIARQHPGGVYLVRIEDTDESRNRDEWTQGIIDALEWLGMPSDTPPERQSENRPFHEAARDALLQAGYLYYCDCSSADVAQRKGDSKTPGYDGFCAERGLGPSDTTALRFKVPHDESLVVHDLVRGDVTFDLAHLEDFVVAKSDGSVLYGLANVVDDRRDRITHVIRGEEHLANAPKQLLLWRALSAISEEVAEPLYAHLPLLVNEQRKKLSKRRDAVATELFRDQGILASAFVNYLGLLGWSPRGDEEKATLETMIEQFRLEDVGQSPAMFDLKKLTHLNGLYLRELSPREFVEACRPWVAPWTIQPCDGDAPSDAHVGLENDAPSDALSPSTLPSVTGNAGPSTWRPSAESELAPPWGETDFDEDLFIRVAPLVHERVAVLSQVPAMVAFFFVEPQLELAELEKSAQGRSGEVLNRVTERLEGCAWRAVDLHEAVASVAEELGLKLRHAQAPLRLAITGSSVGPPLFESMEILGRDKVHARLRSARELLA